MEDFLLIPGFSCFLFVFGHHVCISFVSTMYNRLRQNFNNYFIHNRQVIYYINICKWGKGKRKGQAYKYNHQSIRFIIVIETNRQSQCKAIPLSKTNVKLIFLLLFVFHYLNKKTCFVWFASLCKCVHRYVDNKRYK